MLITIWIYVLLYVIHIGYCDVENQILNVDISDLKDGFHKYMIKGIIKDKGRLFDFV